MAKISHAGPTYYGYEGIVTDARDVKHEIDPSRNLDGSVVDGYESDERELKDRNAEEHAESEVPVLTEPAEEEEQEEEEFERKPDFTPAPPAGRQGRRSR